MDEAALISLVASLHLTDLAERNNSTKGKGRSGEVSDEDRAFELYRAELEAAEQFATDRRLALSLDAAGRQDGEALGVFQREEEQARRDRELALAVSRGRLLPRSGTPSTSTSRFGTPQTSAPSTRATSITRPSSASSSSAQVPVGASFSGASTSPADTRLSTFVSTPVASSSYVLVNCVICTERTPSTRAVQVPCAHRHWYCHGCVRDLFLAALRDESLFPPRCDGAAIPLSLARPHLTSQELDLYRSKAIEFGTTNRLYCSTPSCSAFLGEAQPQSKVGVKCDACQASTCRACKAPWHGVFGLCAAGADDEAAEVLARERGYQRCPGCRRMVELDLGCFHMTCLCSRQFCYLCAADWKNCPCPQWDENRLLRAAQDRVRAEEHNRPTNAPVPLAPRVNRIAEAVETLRTNHECRHPRWRYRDGPGQCQSCYHYLGRFLLRNRL
ncbi:hypothetical protein JCM10213v2_002276 [Rhodosporidiobolus nylandii]